MSMSLAYSWRHPVIGKPSPSDPLKKHKFGGNRDGPRPLRSDQFPNRLPNLTPSELGRVTLANQLYHLTAKVAKWALKSDAFCGRTTI